MTVRKAGLPTYKYPPNTFPMRVRYKNMGHCTNCMVWVDDDDDFICPRCKTEVHTGVEIDDQVYFHGWSSHKNNRFISIYKYPPNKIPEQYIRIILVFVLIVEI